MDPEQERKFQLCPFNSLLSKNVKCEDPISEDENESLWDMDTIPDEEYQKKLQNSKRGNLKSWPNIINYNANPAGLAEGPNINIKLPRKSYSSHEEKKYFFNKIKTKQKTELCKNWSLYSDCYFKDTCSFAHGEHELRKNLVTKDKYKTKYCKMFQENSFCNYGNRCIYMHVIKHIRLFKFIHILNKFASEFNSEYEKIQDNPKEIVKILHKIHSKKQVPIPRLSVFETISREFVD